MEEGTDNDTDGDRGRRPRILFLDAYDSFSNNIVALLAAELGADVEVLPIDSPHFLAPGSGGAGDDDEVGRRLAAALRHYDAVVCGPGPGSPHVARDVGLMRHVWTLPPGDGLAPVLGICLGFQSLALACGAAVRRLPAGGLHGMVRTIDHVGISRLSGQELGHEASVPGVRDDSQQEKDSDDAGGGDIFRGVPPFKATLYHSLHADAGQAGVSAADWPAARWAPPSHLPDLVPLAWTYEGEEEDRILMAMRHRTKPFWGLQYHPESVCTEPAGHRVIRNWFADALRWNRHTSGRRAPGASPYLAAGITRRLPTAHHPAQVTVDNDRGSGLRDGREDAACSSAWLESGSRLATFGLDCQYHSRVVDLPPHIEVPDVVEILQGAPRRGDGGTREFIVLDSASANAAAHASRIGPDVRGRYSVVALDVDQALKLEYRTGDRYVAVRCAAANNLDRPGPRPCYSETVDLGPRATHWQFLSDFWARRSLSLPTKKADTADGYEMEGSGPSPFAGGFMGYATYELGLEGIGVEPARGAAARPDLCFAWVTKSVVLDHVEGTLRVQILAPQSAPSHQGSRPASNPDTSTAAWLDAMVERLSTSAVWAAASGGCGDDLDVGGELTPPLTPTKRAGTGLGCTTALSSGDAVPRVHGVAAPDPWAYEAKVRTCQEYIAAGHSYELCLTDRTTITLTTTTTTTAIDTQIRENNNNHQHRYSNSNDKAKEEEELRGPQDTSWSLYRALRSRQPAPFGSYVRLGGATLVSSSPERFLEHRGGDGGGGSGMVCSMRPMKGTVRKAAGGGGGVATLREAERLLRTPKEEAENLMIVDLVRHDLHGVCGTAAGSVSVPRLLGVEEYASVFQMVSVVEGRLPSSPSPSSSAQTSPRRPLTGLDVLDASLPPGSMTGAPKRRSCELLRQIEDAGDGGERSLYSGVVGYMDVAGRGDWSVTIRSMFRWDDEVVTVRGGGSRGDEEEGEQQLVREEKWHIGAGGAVTALSTPEGETEEMFIKLRGPLGVFGGGF